MPEIDDTYLKVHPRTLLWWEQRKQCYDCANLSLRETPSGYGKGSMVMECLASGSRPSSSKIQGRPREHSTCIEMRDEGQACSTEALLFRAK